MAKGDYHGFSHVYASRAGTRPKREYDEFDFSAEQEARKDELLRAVKRPQLTIHAGYLRRAKTAKEIRREQNWLTQEIWKKK